MFEKCNPSHPDKIADRIAGAIVDLAYAADDNPKIAVEVLIGHTETHIITESTVDLQKHDVEDAVNRITGEHRLVDWVDCPQNKHLRDNQKDEIRCGDNGIFRGCLTNVEERMLTDLTRKLYKKYPSDGKLLISEEALTICQSNAPSDEIRNDPKVLRYQEVFLAPKLIVNPLGDWTGGIWVDTGATNRKIGSDMGYSATGGGLHGKDLSKADVTLNICCHLLAYKYADVIECACSIGDTEITFWNPEASVLTMTYAECVQMAAEFIRSVGGFEKFAEWGIIR